MDTTPIDVGKEMGGHRNALILESFCNNTSADSGIKIQLVIIINYNAENTNEEISLYTAHEAIG